MRSIVILMQLLRKRFFNVEFVRFIVVGGINTCGGYVVYLALIQIMEYTYAYSLSFAISVVVSYLLNTLLVFKEPLALKKFIAFPLIYVFQYISGLCIIHLAVEIFYVSVVLAPLIVVIITLPATFLMARFIMK
ncbi:putative flippase GtrA [Pseudomonas cedrina]|nr:putative flippase GtrA [Pseudomonas cedrina]